MGRNFVLRLAARAGGLVSLAVVVALCLPVGASAAPAERYWSFADQRALEMGVHWDATQGYYRGSYGQTTRNNANMLLIHAGAALAGRTGAARQDTRATSIVRKLLEPPAFTNVGTTSQPHPGWTAGLEGNGEQHVSIDPQVVEALVVAHRARTALGLSAAQADLIVTRIRTAAYSSFYRWPTVRLNQFNWHGDMYAAYYQVSGNRELLRNDYRLQLQRFVSSAVRPSPVTPWLASGSGLIYLPNKPLNQDGNRTTTSEYGGMVLSGLRHYGMAVNDAGMEPLGPTSVDRMRGYIKRQLYGEWTHAGYLNWDSALEYRRWHLLRYWPLAASGLMGVATDTGLSTTADRQMATYLLDAGLDTYDRWNAQGKLTPMAFGITGTFTSDQDRQYVASRWGALAARAALSGIASITPSIPRAYYARDLNIGRLAVSTERYSTAIVSPTTAGYGGGELARLHSSATGEPLSGTGGSRGVAFGVRLAAPDGLTVLDTQSGEPDAPVVSWSLSSGTSRGIIDNVLSASGRVAEGGASVSLTHNFRIASVRTKRVITTPKSVTAIVRFPVWDNGYVRLGTSAAYAGQIIQVGGYEVRLDTVPPSATLITADVTAQPSSPRTRRVVQLRFPMTAGQTRTVEHTLLIAAGTTGAAAALPAALTADPFDSEALGYSITGTEAEAAAAWTPIASADQFAAGYDADA